MSATALCSKYSDRAARARHSTALNQCCVGRRLRVKPRNRSSRLQGNNPLQAQKARRDRLQKCSRSEGERHPQQLQQHQQRVQVQVPHLLLRLPHLCLPHLHLHPLPHLPDQPPRLLACLLLLCLVLSCLALLGLLLLCLLLLVYLLLRNRRSPQSRRPIRKSAAEELIGAAQSAQQSGGLRADLQ